MTRGKLTVIKGSTTFVIALACLLVAPAVASAGFVPPPLQNQAAANPSATLNVIVLGQSGTSSSLLRDRVEPKLAAGEDEGAGPDPVREPLIRALEEERVRRQRRSPREQLLPVAGELEALAGSVVALADPEQLRRRVQDPEGIVGIDQRPRGTRRTTGSPSAVKRLGSMDRLGGTKRSSSLLARRKTSDSPAGSRDKPCAAASPSSSARSSASSSGA